MSLGLEICIDSYHSAKAAIAGGADRLEVCSSLALGGLTPSIGLVRMLKKTFPEAPLFCMLRTRSGNFSYSEDDLNVMKEDLIDLKNAGAAGFVFGFLDEEFNLDVKTCKEFIDLADKLPCTLHRAFDVAQNWKRCLDEAVEIGFKYILTSGRHATAIEGASELFEIVNYAKTRITIMAGSGVNSQNLKQLIDQTNAPWYHGSAAKKVMGETKNKIAMGSADMDDLKYTCSEETRKMKNLLLNSH
ncbi:unnamed protein product [Auanema sp. JU1783]|nr:unnamed protein product [Auanema sp. JU1783]